MRYFLVFLLFSIIGQAQRYDNAVSYLKFIDGHHKDVVEQTWNYMYTYTQEDEYQKRNGQRKKLENVLSRALRYVEKEEAYDIDFQKAVIDYLKGNRAIIQNDYSTLLKMDTESALVIEKNKIHQKIRKAMLQLRVNYDNALSLYGVKHDLLLKSNQSNLALQMEHTIKVYDYYNQLNLQVQEIKDAEAYLWENINTQTPSQFQSKLAALKVSVNKTEQVVLSENLPSNNESLKKAFSDFKNYYGNSFHEETAPILNILKVNSTNDRTDIIKKTEAFNKAKAWFNQNRREAYNLWAVNVQQYLRSEIKPL